MTLPALSTQSTSGLSRSAALMKALGPDAQAVWSALSPQDAARLRKEMQEPGPTVPEGEIAEIFFQDMTRTRSIEPNQTSHLTGLGPDRVNDLVSFVSTESPQITALVLSLTPEETAAATVQALPKQSAIQALHRLMQIDTVHPSAVTAVETAFATRTTSTASQTSGGADRLAGIMNLMDSSLAPTLMAGLDELQPGSAERIRALMFTFDDLATLDPASLQTLLANTDRAVLIIALQDASSTATDAFFRNMTQRAGDVLRSEIESSGPYRRSEIEVAQREIATLARKLARRGDLMSATGPDKDLIE